MLEVPCDARETVSALAGQAQRLVAGDALEVADALSREGLSHTVDLAYVDPPFASQTSYVHEARLEGLGPEDVVGGIVESALRRQPSVVRS